MNGGMREKLLKQLVELFSSMEAGEDGGSTPKETEGIKSLDKSIQRHERHMDGSEPTSESSQMKMMDEMKTGANLIKAGHGADQDEMPAKKGKF